MTMVGVISGSLYRRTHSLIRLAWSWVGGRLAPFHIHQMNRVNSRNDSTINIVVIIIIININDIKYKQYIISADELTVTTRGPGVSQHLTTVHFLSA